MEYPDDPLYAINDYVWRLLKQEHDWSDIGGRIPMAPGREPPEFDGQSKPYIVYRGSRETGRGDFSPSRLATVRYVIFAQKKPGGESATNQVTEALNTIDNALNRLDESAADVNRNAYHPENPRRELFNTTRVNWMRVMDTDSSDPGDEEGGKAFGYISIRYEYTVQERDYPILY